MDDDEWFYESINRYGILQMYDLRLSPFFVKKLSGNVFCFAGVHGNKKSEIITVQLPLKMTTSSEKRRLLKNNDFHILSAGFFVDNILEIESIDGKSAVVCFENSGLSIIDVSSENTEILEGTHILEDLNQNLSIDVSKHKPEIVVTQLAQDDVIIFDCHDMEATRIPYPKALPEDHGNVLCRFTNDNQILLLNADSGSLALLDHRAGVSTSFLGPEVSHSPYAMSHCNKTEIACLSRTGDITIYDIRQGKPLFDGVIEIDELSNSSKPKIQKCGNCLSVSGVHGGVNVYELQGESCVEIFRHTGHQIDNNRDNLLVTDHLWLDHIDDNFIISCAINGSINCWQFLANK